MEKMIEIGYTKKPHGLKGEIKFHVEEKYVEDLTATDTIFIEMKGKTMPFFVEDVRVGNNIIVKLEDVSTPEAAMQLASKKLLLRESDLIPDEEREFEVEADFQMLYGHVEGYTIFDNGTNVGLVASLVEYPQQFMAVVHYNKRDVLVPLNQAFVKKIDDKTKTIEMNLPEGILDL